MSARWTNPDPSPFGDPVRWAETGLVGYTRCGTRGCGLPALTYVELEYVEGGGYYDHHCVPHARRVLGAHQEIPGGPDGLVIEHAPYPDGVRQALPEESAERA